MSNETQIATKTPVVALGEWLALPGRQNAFKQAMPKSMEIEPFMRCLFTAVQRTPKLTECTRDSVYDAAIRSAQTGLPPDGYHAHLLPFKGKATFIPDWKGLVKLAYNAGIIIQAEIVCDNDDFAYDRGVVQRHIRADIHPDKSKRQERGEMYAVYAICTLADGRERAELMSLPEVERIRKASPNGNSEYSPWTSHFSEMAKKTVVKRLCKWLPRSTELQQALEEPDPTIDVEVSRMANPELTDSQPANETANVTPPERPAIPAKRGRPAKGLAAAAATPVEDLGITTGATPAAVVADAAEPAAPESDPVVVPMTPAVLGILTDAEGEETDLTAPVIGMTDKSYIRGEVTIKSVARVTVPNGGKFFGQTDYLAITTEGPLAAPGNCYSHLFDEDGLKAGSKLRVIITGRANAKGTVYPFLTKVVKEEHVAQD